MIRASAFDCSCSLFKHGVTQNERRNLGNLNPIYERERSFAAVFIVRAQRRCHVCFHP